MLKTYINTVPYTKFVLIIDSIEDRDLKFFDHLVQQHFNRNQHKIHYCVFEGVFKRSEDKFQNYPKAIVHNFVSDIEEEKDSDSFEQLALKMRENDIIIIDSLANAIFRYGFSATYKMFNTLSNNKALKQIIAVLHKDLLQEDFDKAGVYFANLSTLSIYIQPKLKTDAPRVKYVYKKTGGKIISEIEEYSFEGQHLITNKIAKPDVMKLLEKATPQPVNPEELSTFKIGLTDEEKLSRDKVVLPYLPEANPEKPQEEGKVFYQFDEVDDWDEEDPDDDLDI